MNDSLHLEGFGMCITQGVRTNIDIDERLLEGARKAAGTSTKKATVEHALRELVRRKDRAKVRDLLGTVDWQGDLDETRSGRQR